MQNPYQDLIPILYAYGLKPKLTRIHRGNFIEYGGIYVEGIGICGWDLVDKLRELLPDKFRVDFLSNLGEVHVGLKEDIGKNNEGEQWGYCGGNKI